MHSCCYVYQFALIYKQLSDFLVPLIPSISKGCVVFGSPTVAPSL